MTEYDGPERRKPLLHCQAEILDELSSIKLEVKQNTALLEQCTKFITGNGDAQKGAIIRMDRLEQAEAIRTRHAGWAWASIIALAVKAFWDSLVKP